MNARELLRPAMAIAFALALCVAASVTSSRAAEGPPQKSSYGQVRGEDARDVVEGRKRFVLEGKRLLVSWSADHGKYDTSLFVIRNCETVVIRDLHVIQADADYRASCSVLVEDCGRVLVENCSFSGTCSSHLRVEGCAEVTIRNVEIFGRDYGADGVRCGRGIFVNNGDDTPGKYPGHVGGLFSEHPRDMRALTIRDCLVRDNLDQDRQRNLDGILIHSASDGGLSGCRFENWLCGDAALDVSHRRLDTRYVHKSFRVERNIFSNCRFAKTVGASRSSNSILWCNNVYTDTPLADYHSGWDNWHVHEDFVFTGPAFRFMALWGMAGGRTVFRNSLFVLPDTKTIFHTGQDSRPDDYLSVDTDSNLYLVDGAPLWAGGKGPTIRTWAGWKALGNDHLSRLVRMRAGPWEPQADRRSVTTTGPFFGGWQVDEDFNGARRPLPPAVGAFEPDGGGR